MLGGDAFGMELHPCTGWVLCMTPMMTSSSLSAVTSSTSGTVSGARDALTIAPDSVPDTLEVTAASDDDVIMGVMHRSHPVHGVQFHPESIASEHGHQILKNFLDIADAWNKRNRIERRVA